MSKTRSRTSQRPIRNDTAGELRPQRSLIPLRPFEILSDNGWEDPAHVRAETHRLRREGWRCGVYLLNLLKPFDWEYQPSRDFGWRLQAWEPIELLLLAFADGDEEAFSEALSVALSWLDRYGADEKLSDESFAWYDMSFPWRAQRLAFLLDLACRRANVSDKIILRLSHAMDEHFTAILSDDQFHGHNNHGFYQSLAALAAATRWREHPLAARVIEVSQARLAKLFDTLIDADGVLLEHSPGYHLSVLRLLERAAAANLLTPEQLQRQEAMGRALAWFVMPDGKLAPFGDTSPTLFRQHESSGPVRFHRNAYRRPEGVRERHFDNAGFWVAREGDSALAVQAGFHSMTHKHADHGTFVLYENGNPLLVEAGFFPYEGRTEEQSAERREGFYYSDPRRIYVESTRAHNCVEIGGESYLRRNVPFFGSAIRHARFDETGAVTAMRFQHKEDIVHDRLLAWVPGRFLLVVDELVAPRPLPVLRQWFHLASGVDVTPAPAGWRGETVAITSLIPGCEFEGPFIGLTEPALQGWHGTGEAALAPHSALAVKSGGNANHLVFATLLTPGSPPSVRPDAAFLRDKDAGALVWDDKKGDVSVTVYRSERGLDAKIGTPANIG